MKTFALITVLAATLAAPVAAQTPLEIAVANFNASAETASDRINTDVSFGGPNSGASADALALAIAIHNQSVDNAGDLINGSFQLSSGPTGRNAEIFARLAEADDSN